MPEKIAERAVTASLATQQTLTAMIVPRNARISGEWYVTMPSAPAGNEAIRARIQHTDGSDNLLREFPIRLDRRVDAADAVWGATVQAPVIPAAHKLVGVIEDLNDVITNAGTISKLEIWDLDVEIGTLITRTASGLTFTPPSVIQPSATITLQQGTAYLTAVNTSLTAYTTNTALADYATDGSTCAITLGPKPGNTGTKFTKSGTITDYSGGVATLVFEITKAELEAINTFSTGTYTITAAVAGNSSNTVKAGYGPLVILPPLT